jgi:membrane protease YdiL (CAAX protease family)
MSAVLLTQFLIGMITFLMLLIVGKRKILSQYRFVIIFFLFYFVDNLAIALANRFPGLQFIPKTYSILITLALLCAFRSMLSPDEAGISLRQNTGSFVPSAGVLLAIALWSSFVGSHLPQGELSVSTLVYLAVMPGLNEELIYRGVLPACLDKIFSKNWSLAAAKVGWSTAITTVLFGLLHGLWLDDGFQSHIEVVWIRNALLSGFIFAWLRERTGSLIMPILAHGAWDFFLFLPRMI